MKPKHQRLIFILVTFMAFMTAVLATMEAFRENLVFFYSPSELATQPVINDTTLIRVGGLVASGSIQKNTDDNVHFDITDGQKTIRVAYQGILPTLFREGQGVVAEGYLHDKSRLKASRILTKHDENYMPKDVVDSLKKSGYWQEKGS